MGSLGGFLDYKSGVLIDRIVSLYNRPKEIAFPSCPMAQRKGNISGKGKKAAAPVQFISIPYVDVFSSSLIAE